MSRLGIVLTQGGLPTQGRVGNDRFHCRIPITSCILRPGHFPQCLSILSGWAPGLQASRLGQRIITQSTSPNTNGHHGRILAYCLATTPSAYADSAPPGHLPGPCHRPSEASPQPNQLSEHWGSRFAQDRSEPWFILGRE